MVASTFSTAALVGLLTALLSTTALAAAPEAGAALPAETGMAPPEVRPLPETTISGQRFTADDRVIELLLRDGTSLTLARGGALSIDEFVFDPTARIARLHLTLERGLLRVGGGRPAFAEPVIVTTPAGEAKLTQGVGPAVGRLGRHDPGRPLGRRAPEPDRGRADRGGRPTGLRDLDDPRRPAPIGRAPGRGRDGILYGRAQPWSAGRHHPRRRSEAPAGQATAATDTLSFGGFHAGDKYQRIDGSGDQDGNFGFYAMGQQMVYREGAPGSAEGLTPWLAVAYQPQQSISLLPVFLSGGAVYEA